MAQKTLKMVQEFYETLQKALGYITNIANGNIFLNQIISVVNQTISSVISSLAKPVLNALNNLGTSLSKDLSDTSNKIENIVECLMKNNQTSRLFAVSLTLESKLKDLFGCSVEVMKNASQPVGDTLQIVSQIAQASITNIKHGLECGMNPIGGILNLPNIPCFAKYGLQSFVNGAAQTSGIVNSGTRIVNNILTLIPKNIECVNKKMNNFVENLTKVGINATGCL